MGQSKLRYYLHDGRDAFRMELSGELNARGAGEIEQVWHTARSAAGGSRVVVDITNLTFFDGHGRALLEQWSREGVEIVRRARTKPSKLIGWLRKFFTS